jgi:hypothetical protein
MVQIINACEHVCMRFACCALKTKEFDKDQGAWGRTIQCPTIAMLVLLQLTV